MLYVYNCILLKMSTWRPKNVEENIILWINNNQWIKIGNWYIVKPSGAAGGTVMRTKVQFPKSRRAAASSSRLRGKWATGILSIRHPKAALSTQYYCRINSGTVRSHSSATDVQKNALHPGMLPSSSVWRITSKNSQNGRCLWNSKPDRCRISASLPTSTCRCI